MSNVFLLANDESTIYNFRRELIQKLVNTGYRVTVAFPRGGSRTEEIQRMGCHFIDLAMERKGVNPLSDLNLIRRIKNVLIENNPDILLTFTIKPNLYGGLAAGMLKLPHIANVTGLGTAVENRGILQLITLQMYRSFMRHTKYIFFQNQENLEFLQRKRAIKNHAKLLPGSGVNLSKYQLLPYPDTEVVKFLYVGRVMKEKGINQFLEAARIIKKDNSNVEFHIVGPCEEDYHELLKRYHEEKMIIYHGEQKDVRSFYRHTHCTIHPTYYPEGMSNVLLESAASGSPVITTNRSGCREIVDNNKTGFFVNERDTHDLVDKIQTFLELDAHEKEQMGKRGRQKVEKEFDREKVVTTYVQTIEEIKKRDQSDQLKSLEL